MGQQEHFEKNESGLEKGETSQLEGVIKHGEELVTHFEHQKNNTAKDIERLPPEVDRSSFNEKLTTMDRIGKEAKKATLAASFLMLTSNAALAESSPKDFEAIPQTEVQLFPSMDAESVVRQSTMVLEVVKGVAQAAVEQQKKDVETVIKGTDTNGKEISTRDRVEKAVNLIPSKVPKLGPLAGTLSTIMEIQKDISEAKQGYEKNVARKVALLLADRATHGLASFAWSLLAPKEEKKREPDAVASDTQNETVRTEETQPILENLPTEGDRDESDPVQTSQVENGTKLLEKEAVTE